MDKENAFQKEILRYTDVADKAWQSLSEEAQNILKKNFFLRPTNSGVNIIATLPSDPMRGLKKYIKRKEDLFGKLMEIYSYATKFYSMDTSIVRETIKAIGFNYRGTPLKDQSEEQIQAYMIRSMSNDLILKQRLSAKGSIKYIASEFIFEAGSNRVDIIGFDDKDLFIFELKKISQTSLEQVKGYVSYYSLPEKRDVVKNILKIYPINNVPNFSNIKGVMVMPGSKNSPFDWAKLATDYSLATGYSVEIMRFDKDYNWI